MQYLLLTLILFLLGSCSTPECPAPEKIVQVDTVYREKVVYKTDTVWRKEYVTDHTYHNLAQQYFTEKKQLEEELFEAQSITKSLIPHLPEEYQNLFQ